MSSLPTRRMVLAGMASLTLWGTRLQHGDRRHARSPSARHHSTPSRGAKWRLRPAVRVRACRLTASLLSTTPCRRGSMAGRRRSCMRCTALPAPARTSTGRTSWKAGLRVSPSPRTVGSIAHSRSRLASPRGLALGAVVPLTIRGRTPTLSWIPKVNALPLGHRPIARLIDLYAQTRSGVRQGVEIGRGADAGAVASWGRRPARGSPSSIASSPTPPRRQRDFLPPPKDRASASSATTVGIRTPGKASSGDSWPTTVAPVIAEFGRTARRNGSEGADHDRATVALVIGRARRRLGHCRLAGVE
jgi:hypothetical protein